MAKPLNEQRACYRFPFNRSVTFEMSIGGNPVDTDGSPSYYGVATNVSDGGMCILTHAKLEKSQVIKVGLPLPNVDTKVKVLAEVRWEKTLGVPGNLVGLSFFM